MTKSRLVFAAWAFAFLLPAQNVPAPATAEPSVTFQTKVNLVPVPVVVRDRQSHAIGNLTKDDFRVFDNGKPQVVTRFSIEKSGLLTDRGPASGAGGASSASSTPVSADSSSPDRFVGYVFDDLHFSVSDLMQARQAALKHFDGLDTGTSRAAVFTTSGVNPQDFTADRPKLQAALDRLMPRSRANSPHNECPHLNYYTADLIVNRDDPEALQEVARAMMSCPFPPPTMQLALTLTRANAFHAASVGETETRITLSVLRNMVKRMALMPGQRTLVLVSPGFIFPAHEQDISQLIDLAVRLNVVINSIDGRGLFVDGQYDASRSLTSTALAEYERDEARAAGDTLSLLAEGTGGTAFANSNDLLAGFRRTGSQAEFTYVLGFSPQNLKTDGKFHSIKVKLKESSGLTVQARRGYFAPKHALDPGDQAKQDIDEALFSREEFQDFPLSIATQFSKSSSDAVSLIVVAKVGLKGFHFNRIDGLSKDRITMVTVLFDRDGNYLNGQETNVDIHYKDEMLQEHVKSGLMVKIVFDKVKPGSYLVRQVARDSEGHMISAANSAVEVP